MTTQIPLEASEQALLEACITSVVETRAAIASLQAFEATVFEAATELALARAERRPAGRRDSQLEVRQIAAEFAAALRVSDRTLQRELSDASTLVGGFPRTHEALSAGRISRAHANAILDAGASLGEEARASFEAASLDVAFVESATRTRPIAKIIAAQHDARSLEQVHADSLAKRAVRVRPLDDGMAELRAELPVVLAYGIHDRITQMAVEFQRVDARRASEHTNPTGLATVSKIAGSDGAGPEVGPPPAETRTIDQLRADIMCDLVLAGTPAAVANAGTAMAGIVGRVQVVVPVLTLAGVSDEPTELAGFGAIAPAAARALAGAAPGWDRIFVHPVKRCVLAVDRYRPGPEIERQLVARDRHCRFPGCRMPVRLCDVDHTVDAALGGETSIRNLAHLCRRHHTLKHATDWSVKQLEGGVLEWTSPGGRVFTDVARPVVGFRPDHLVDRGQSATATDGDPPPF